MRTTMLTDVELKNNGIKALVDKLGEVEAERFISLINQEKFDYTEWQKKLWKNKSVEELNQMASDFDKKKSNK